MPRTAPLFGVDLPAAVAGLGSVARRTDLERLGATRAQLRDAVTAGDLVLVRPGGYALPHAPADVVRALRWSGSVTCVSALAMHGFALLRPPAATHLSSPGDAGHRGGRSCRWHRDERGPRIADVLPAAAQALRCVDHAGALAIADQVLRHEWDRADLAARLPRRGSATARWVLDHADPRAESVLESALRCALLRGGITGIEPQVTLVDVGRVDFLVAGWLVVEADGWGTHSDKAAFVNDRRRVVAAMQDGRVTVRFTFAEVVDHPDDVAAAVRVILDRTVGGRFSTLVTEARGRPPS